MVASSLLSTDAVPIGDRIPQWREWISRHFGGLESDLYGDTQFDGSMATSHAGEVVLTRLESNRHRVQRTSQMARHDESVYLKIVAPWRGRATVLQHGREASAQNGSWVIYDTSSAYEIANRERVDHLIVMVPHSERKPRATCAMTRQLGLSGISRVALETMRNTYLELPNMSLESARGAGELIKQLVQMSLMELAGQETATTQRIALRDRIRSYVAQHLRDPSLSIDGMALALNCSRRHLYNAFAGDGQTIAAYIQRERLQACVRDLQHDSTHGKPSSTITEVAMSWGFGNPSHFSRVFREYTGASPSEFRGNPV